MTKGRRPDDDVRRREAEQALRNAAEGDVLGGIARGAGRAGRHFAGDDADPADRVEVWGRRIGRGLSLAFLVVLIVWLANTYL